MDRVWLKGSHPASLLMIDSSRLFPTFLALLRIPDPRRWLAGILPAAIVDALRMSFFPNTAHAKALSVAAARKSIALGPDHYSHLDHQLRVEGDKTDTLNGSHIDNVNSPELGNSSPSRKPQTSPEIDPKMTQLHSEGEDSPGTSLTLSSLFCYGLGWRSSS